MSSMEGLNGTVFAYGQTASGKTYSMVIFATNINIYILSFKFLILIKFPLLILYLIINY